MYLDSNIERFRRGIIRHLREELTLAMQGKMAKDYKTLLAGIGAKRASAVRFRTSSRTKKGPDHAKTFVSMCLSTANGRVRLGYEQKRMRSRRLPARRLKRFTKKKIRLRAVGGSLIQPVFTEDAGCEK